MDFFFCLCGLFYTQGNLSASGLHFTCNIITHTLSTSEKYNESSLSRSNSSALCVTSGAAPAVRHCFHLASQESSASTPSGHF